jgi:hypothetical protein
MLGTFLFTDLFVFCLICKNINIKMCKIILLPVVSYGCETWFLTLWEEHRLRRVFENRVPRKIFGYKREDVAGGCRRLHYEGL